MPDPTSRILIVDDEEVILKTLSSLVTRAGFEALVAADGETAVRKVGLEKPDALLVDFNLPGSNGIQVMQRVHELDRSLPVIIMTGHSIVPEAVRAMRLGARDWLTKPFDVGEVVQALRQALAGRASKLQAPDPPGRLPPADTLFEMMGSSDQIRRLNSEVNRVATADFNVVVAGETGAGKELVSRCLHQLSPRARGSFIPIDCGAIPETLLENELFGHAKGAYTGATQEKPGKLEEAREGTLFLDEIANLPLGSQAKLLRFLQEKSFSRLGGLGHVQVNLRIIAATNQNLQAFANSGLFRPDLFYRLNEYTITVPPLRERKEDIFHLAQRFLDLANLELGKQVRGFTEAAMETLLNFGWPGNVRQLRSVIRRAVLVADEIIAGNHLELDGVGRPGPGLTPRVQGIPWQTLSLKEIVQQHTLAVEREVLTQALNFTEGNKAEAARLLKIDYKTIHTKLKALGISKDKGGGVHGDEKDRWQEEPAGPGQLRGNLEGFH
jgi:two-component system nitrogen regulation response regulator GlnG